MPQAYTLVDVFTEAPFSGNQLAVFPRAAAFTPEQMHRIAKELNLSETAFVMGRDGSRARVRIFTPEGELPFAGHPSLGTAAVVHGFAPKMGQVVLQLGVGDVPVRIEPTRYGAKCELAAPPAQELPLPATPKQIAVALSLKESDLDPALPSALWSCGNAFLLVPLRSRERVAAARCPATRPKGVLGLVPFAFVGDRAIHARVFIPGSSVAEDPATGSAAAPLAAYLQARGRIPDGTIVIGQGIEIGRPSRLEVRMEQGADGILRPHVAGGVVRVGEGSLDLPA